MTRSGDRSGGSGELQVLLACGIVWCAACYALIATRLAPPQRLSGYAVLAFQLLFLALGHAAAWTGLSRAGARLLAAHRWRRGYDAGIALVAGAAYAWLALSLAKYSLTRSHLRYEDLWFVAGSLRQLGGEGSARERLALLAAAALPLVLAVVVFSALRWRARDSRPLPARTLLLLGVLAASGFAVTCWRYPYARFAAGTLFPETS